LAVAIDTAFSLQVLPDRSGKRLNARVIGMREGESIIACIHQAGFGAGDLRLDDEVAVRFMVGRSVYGFKSTVIRICLSPYSYFHLAYPTEIQHVEVRQTERIGLAIPAQVDCLQRASIEAELRDLSSSGALIVTTDALGSAGDQIRMHFELSLGQMRRKFQLDGTIRNAGPFIDLLSEVQRHRHGVQFKEAGEADTLFILAFVYEKLATARTAAPFGNQNTA
jgi:c-di-GMP-binding flagellar brake protein YcgR